MFDLAKDDSKYPFTGLGCSILNKDSFTPSVYEKTWKVSNKIIRSDFFSKSYKL